MKQFKIKRVTHNIEIYTVYIDQEDWEKIKQYKWCIHQGYVSTNINGKTIHLHRLILNCPVGFVVDHINGNKRDNRKCNLRIITQAQNIINSYKHRANDCGVYYHSADDRWISRVGYDKKTICLGSFQAKEEALNAYKQKTLKLYGE